MDVVTGIVQWFAGLFWGAVAGLEQLLTGWIANLLDFENGHVGAFLILVVLAVVLLAVVDFFAQLRWKRAGMIWSYLQQEWRARRRRDRQAQERRNQLREVQAESEKLPEAMVQRLLRPQDEQDEQPAEPDPQAFTRTVPPAQDAKTATDGQDAQEATRMVPAGQEAQAAAQTATAGQDAQEATRIVPAGQDAQDVTRIILAGQDPQPAARAVPNVAEAAGSRTARVSLSSTAAHAATEEQDAQAVTRMVPAGQDAQAAAHAATEEQDGQEVTRMVHAGQEAQAAAHAATEEQDAQAVTRMVPAGQEAQETTHTVSAGQSAPQDPATHTRLVNTETPPPADGTWLVTRTDPTHAHRQNSWQHRLAVWAAKTLLDFGSWLGHVGHNLKRRVTRLWRRQPTQERTPQKNPRKKPNAVVEAISMALLALGAVWHRVCGLFKRPAAPKTNEAEPKRDPKQ